jgi:hypothetical protein
VNIAKLPELLQELRDSPGTESVQLRGIDIDLIGTSVASHR